MGVKITELETNKVQLEFKVEPSDFLQAIDKAYMKTRNSFKIDGFRPGKAPKMIIEQHYGADIFFEEAIDIIFPDAYEKAAEEYDKVIVSRPEVNIVSVSKEDGVVFTADVFIRPEVKLGDYKSIKIEKESALVTEDDVEDYIKSQSEKNARFVEVERPAETGDSVIIDYSGSIDGVKFEGGTAQEQKLDLGSNTFIPGFEDQVVGMQIGEEKDITVTFPDEYQDDLAGKQAVFAIKMHSIKEKQLPEIDDEFAQDISEFDTLEEYKASVRAELQDKKNEAVNNKFEGDVLDAVCDSTDIDIPQSMIETQVDYQIQDFEYSLMYQGLKLDDFMQYSGISLEGLKDSYRDKAEKTVKLRLILEAIGKAEKIEPSPEELEEKIAVLAEQSKKEVEEYKKSMTTDQIEYIKEGIEFDKIIDFVKQCAQS